MTRSNAREVAVHMIYELGFGSRSAEELLEHEMTRERFAQLGEEEPLYAQFPNEKQRQYIRDLVQGNWCLPGHGWCLGHTLRRSPSPGRHPGAVHSCGR